MSFSFIEVYLTDGTTFRYPPPRCLTRWTAPCITEAAPLFNLETSLDSDLRYFYISSGANAVAHSTPKVQRFRRFVVNFVLPKKKQSNRPKISFLYRKNVHKSARIVSGIFLLIYVPSFRVILAISATSATTMVTNV